MSNGIVITSDWHLDGRTAGAPRFDDVDRAGWHVVERASADDVDALLFLGDLCDPDSACVHRAVGAFATMCGMLREKKKRVIVVPGNHDVVEDEAGSTIYDGLAPWVEVVRSPLLLTVAGVTMFVLPYVPRSRSYDPAAEVENEAFDEVQLVVGHLNADGVQIGSESSDFLRGRDVFWPHVAIRKRWPNALMVGGHYHGPQTSEHGITFVGSTTVLTFGEEGHVPRYLVARAAKRSGKVPTVESVPMPAELVRRVVTVRTAEDAAGVGEGELVRVCSKDAAVTEAVSQRAPLSLCPGPVEAEDAAPATSNTADYEATALELAEHWGEAEGPVRAAVVEVVKGVLEQARAA